MRKTLCNLLNLNVSAKEKALLLISVAPADVFQTGFQNRFKPITEKTPGTVLKQPLKTMFSFRVNFGF